MREMCCLVGWLVRFLLSLDLVTGNGVMTVVAPEVCSRGSDQELMSSMCGTERGRLWKEILNAYWYPSIPPPFYPASSRKIF